MTRSQKPLVGILLKDNAIWTARTRCFDFTQASLDFHGNKQD